jgi:hypothetical protein
MISVLSAPRHMLEGLVLDLGYSVREVNNMQTRQLRYIVFHQCEPDRSPEDYTDWDLVDDYER